MQQLLPLPLLPIVVVVVVVRPEGGLDGSGIALEHSVELGRLARLAIKPLEPPQLSPHARCLPVTHHLLLIPKRGEEDHNPVRYGSGEAEQQPPQLVELRRRRARSKSELELDARRTHRHDDREQVGARHDVAV